MRSVIRTNEIKMTRLERMTRNGSIAKAPELSEKKKTEDEQKNLLSFSCSKVC